MEKQLPKIEDYDSNIQLKKEMIDRNNLIVKQISRSANKKVTNMIKLDANNN